MLIDNPKDLGGRCLVFRDRDIILKGDGELPSLTDVKILIEEMPTTVFFAEPEYNICVLGLKSSRTDDTPLPQGFTTKQIRFYADSLNDETAALKVFRGKALLSWREENKFCPTCGKPLTVNPESNLTALECSGCKKTIFPRINPCIIVLVHRGDKMLLACHRQRSQDIYACIAGFMEAGETAEQTVARELMEETGIKVKNIKYFGTQSWPFPSQLMIAYTAEWESGELSLQDDELSDAGWFTKDNCPATPQPGSIAYRMIRQFIMHNS